jgi:hypothetical protein
VRASDFGELALEFAGGFVLVAQLLVTEAIRLVRVWGCEGEGVSVWGLGVARRQKQGRK